LGCAEWNSAITDGHTGWASEYHDHIWMVAFLPVLPPPEAAAPLLEEEEQAASPTAAADNPAVPRNVRRLIETVDMASAEVPSGEMDPLDTVSRFPFMYLRLRGLLLSAAGGGQRYFAEFSPDRSMVEGPGNRAAPTARRAGAVDDEVAHDWGGRGPIRHLHARWDLPIP
jgi:hypothetical protein